jgi:hypothetical protein
VETVQRSLATGEEARHPVGRHYGGRLLREGAWRFFAAALLDGWFVGKLSDPMPVSADLGGRLTVWVAHVA